MNRRRMVVVSLLVLGLQALVSAWAWPQLPADAQVPVHWSLDGQVDGWADKTVGLAVLPLTTLALTGLFAVLPSIEPRRRNLEQSWRGYRAIWASILVLLVGLHLAIVAVGLDQSVDVSRLLVAGMGAMFVVIGNYLPTMRSTWFIGIRTPWTLASERSWTRTHRLGGRLFVAAGLVVALAGLLDVGRGATLTIAVAGIMIPMIAAIAYSYVVWRSDPSRRTL